MLLFLSLSGNLRSNEEGADTIVWLALQPNDKLRSGAFFFDREEARKHLIFAGTNGSHSKIDSIIESIRSLCGLSSWISLWSKCVFFFSIIHMSIVFYLLFLKIYLMCFSLRYNMFVIYVVLYMTYIRIDIIYSHLVCFGCLKYPYNLSFLL